MQCYTMLLKLVRSICEVFWKKSYFQWGELVSSFPPYKILFICSGQVSYYRLLLFIVIKYTASEAWLQPFLGVNVRRTWMIIVFFFLDIVHLVSTGWEDGEPGTQLWLWFIIIITINHKTHVANHMAPSSRWQNLTPTGLAMNCVWCMDPENESDRSEYVRRGYLIWILISHIVMSKICV